MAAVDASSPSSSSSAAPRRVNTPPSPSSNNGAGSDNFDRDLELELELERPEPDVGDDVEWGGSGGSSGQGRGRGIRLAPLGRKQEYGNRHDDEEDEEDEEGRRFLPGRGAGDAQAEDAVQDYELYTPDEEAAVVKRLDRRLVLFMGLLYMLSFLDRSSMCHHRCGLRARCTALGRGGYRKASEAHGVALDDRANTNLSSSQISVTQRSRACRETSRSAQNNTSGFSRLSTSPTSCLNGLPYC